MAAEHSRTPWHQDSARPEMVFDADGRLVVDCDHHGLFSRERAQAHGALVAAAPEMLVRLKGMLGLAEFLINAVDVDTDRTKVVLRMNGEAVAEVPIAVVLVHSKAAVAKAEGR
ncbi:hypothetical protein ABID82_005021 [Methylobacterium sp. PvP062]|uniref:Uncharacterized protein n=1 Tax=Methylobacterium radiotolerans TaxID=31998 RepID=A0ABV2NP28_9HYPH|nr:MULTISPECIES: hypothetical protein [unclassified Methylobacterium]MBP2494994.1 hypothetical protein [Methylobacterium sp. PvP105]MBP2505135.1 hypothetical protein [Methylobacterium sp. PvP109]MCX7336504.1 hypothetical protein [Hyphomicrobiales bacterium]